jgi:hypothetical protein
VSRAFHTFLGGTTMAERWGLPIVAWPRRLSDEFSSSNACLGFVVTPGI